MVDLIPVMDVTWVDPDRVEAVVLNTLEPTEYRAHHALTVKIYLVGRSDPITWSFKSDKKYTTESMQELVADKFAELFEARGDFFQTSRP